MDVKVQKNIRGVEVLFYIKRKKRNRYKYRRVIIYGYNGIVPIVLHGRLGVFMDPPNHLKLWLPLNFWIYNLHKNRVTITINDKDTPKLIRMIDQLK